MLQRGKDVCFFPGAALRSFKYQWALNQIYKRASIDLVCIEIATNLDIGAIRLMDPVEGLLSRYQEAGYEHIALKSVSTSFCKKTVNL